MKHVWMPHVFYTLKNMLITRLLHRLSFRNTASVIVALFALVWGNHALALEGFRPEVKTVMINGELLYESGVISGRTVDLDDPLNPVEVSITFVNKGDQVASENWRLFVHFMDKGEIAVGVPGALYPPADQWEKGKEIVITARAALTKLEGKRSKIYMGLYCGAPRVQLFNPEAESGSKLYIGAIRVKESSASGNEAGPRSNLLGAGSDFEVGSQGFIASTFNDIRGVFAKPGIQPAFDQDTKYEGEYSLKLTASDPEQDLAEALYGRGWKESRLNYHNMVNFSSIKLDPHKTYTLSAWMKTDSDDMVAFLTTWENIHGFGNSSFLEGHTFSVSKEWQRYSVTFKPDQFKVLNFRYPRAGISSEVTQGTLWIDNVQLEEGDTASPYMATPLAFGVSMEQAHNLYTPSELKEKPMLARFRNNESCAAEVTVDYTVRDYWDNIVAEGAITANLAAHSNQSKEVMLPDLPYGYYRAMFDSADGVHHDEVLFGIYESAKTTQNNSWIGYHHSLNSIADASPLQSKLGFGWTRVFRRFSLAMVCPKEGEYNFVHTDTLVENCKKAGIKIVPILGDFLANRPGDHMRPRQAIPDWAVEREAVSSVPNSWARDGVLFPKIDVWKDYIRTVVSRYKDDIQTWEILNEPNCWATADEYFVYLKAAYEAAKEADPNCIIVGGGATSDWGGSPASWTTRLLELDRTEHLDVLAIHLYSTTSPEKTQNIGTENIIAVLKTQTGEYGRDIPIWHTEKNHVTTRGGYTEKEMNLPELYNREQSFEVYDFRAKAEYIIRETLIVSSVGKGPFFLFTPPPNEEFNYNFIGPYALSAMEYDGAPCPELIAVNGFARMLEGRSSPVGMVKLTTNDYSAIYQGSEGILVALWNSEAETWLELPQDFGNFSLYNWFGAETPKPEDGRLQIGTAPVYLLFDTSDVELVKAKLLQCRTSGSAPSFSGGLELQSDALALAIYTLNNRQGEHSATIRLGEIPSGWSFTQTAANVTGVFEQAVRTAFPAGTIAPSDAVQTFTFDVAGERGALTIPPIRSEAALRAVLSPSTEAEALVINPEDVVIDGDLSEWTEAGLFGAAVAEKVIIGRSNWNSPADLSGEMRFRWDSNQLYLGAVVYDDVVERNAAVERGHASDCIELFLGMNADNRSLQYEKGDFQLFLAPGMEASDQFPVADAWCVQFESDADIEIASKQMANGYVIEAAIPWESLQPGFSPSKGTEILMSFTLKDSDEIGGKSTKAISWAGDDGNWRSNMGWGTLELK